MKPSNVIKALNTLIDCKQPTFIWGPPGVGKSDIVQQVAKKMELKLNDVRAILLDPVDLRGLPTIGKDNTAIWATPGFLPKKGNGILFLDELNAAPPLVQAACYQLILDRRLGDYTLPKGWAIIGAGNRESDRAVTSRMPTALANRFTHIDFEVDLSDWVAWALRNDIFTPIIGFLQFRPEMLHQFDPSKNDKSFPTPRAWKFVSNILKQDPDEIVEFDLLKGTIGEAATTEFLAFLKIFRKLPSPDGILLDPASAKVPKDPSALYALTGALAQKASEQTLDRIVEYSKRMPKEFSVLLIKNCISLDQDLQSTRAFIDWANCNQDVMV